MYAFLDEKRHDNNENNNNDDDDDNNKEGLGSGNTSSTTTATITKKNKKMMEGKDGANKLVLYRGDDDDDDDDDDARLLTQLSIKQRRLQGTSTTSSNWSVETNEEYDRIIKELAEEAGSSDSDTTSSSGDIDDDDDNKFPSNENTTSNNNNNNIMGGNSVDHPLPITMLSREKKNILPNTTATMTTTGTNNSNPSSSSLPNIDEKDDEDEDGNTTTTDSRLMKNEMEGNIEKNKQPHGKIRRAVLTRLLTDLAEKARESFPSATSSSTSTGQRGRGDDDDDDEDEDCDNHSPYNTTLNMKKMKKNQKSISSAVAKMEAMAASVAAATEASTNTLEYRPPTIPDSSSRIIDYSSSGGGGGGGGGELESQSQQKLFHQVQKNIILHSEDFNNSTNQCYYLPTKSHDGKQLSSSSMLRQHHLPTLLSRKQLPPQQSSSSKRNNNRRSTIESDSMWTRRSSDATNSSSSGGKSSYSQWFQQQLSSSITMMTARRGNGNNDNDDDDDDPRMFNESQFSLDSDFNMSSHTSNPTGTTTTSTTNHNNNNIVDEESLQHVLDNIIRGNGGGSGRRSRRGRGRSSSKEGHNAEDVDDDEEESPFRFERGQHQHYRPGQQTIHRCIGILFALAVIIGSAALIGISVERNKNSNSTTALSNLFSSHNSTATPLLTTSGNTTMDEIISTMMASTPKYTESDLYFMAKSVYDNCRADQFVTAAGRWECQQICHSHYCCFEYEKEDAKYDCHEDVAQLCPIFTGCEILVIHDVVSSFNELESDNIGSISEGAAVNNNNNAQEENELGWQEVRQNYINAHCDETNLITDTGREQCNKACEHHRCCYDAGAEGTGSCANNPSMTCHVYAACQILWIGPTMEDDASGSGGLDPHTVVTTVLPITSAIPIPPEMLGEEVLPQEDHYYNDDENEESIIQYTNDELLQMQADVQERCSDTQTSTGRFHCENICQFHFCCFDTPPNGCFDDPASLCNVYESCKVLMQPFSPLSDDNEEQESSTPQMALISAEEEYNEMQTYAPAQSFTVFHDSYAPSQSAIVVQESYAPILSSSAVEQTTNMPMTPMPVIPPPPPPTPFPVVSIPIAASTSPVISIVSITSVSTSTPIIHSDNNKPPPRPPIRCVPEGDDEINIEVFTDDWNDDRFDRCARWESKYNMTVTEYWDTYGATLLM